MTAAGRLRAGRVHDGPVRRQLNWRGPIWFPLNYLAVSAIELYHRFFGADLTVEYPTGSGRQPTLDLVAADLRARLGSS